MSLTGTVDNHVKNCGRLFNVVEKGLFLYGDTSIMGKTMNYTSYWYYICVCFGIFSDSVDMKVYL